LPEASVNAEIRLRLRVPGGARIRAVKMNGRDWGGFDPDLGMVTLPPGSRGTVAVEAMFAPSSGK
jgi:hypothetical protein